MSVFMSPNGSQPSFVTSLTLSQKWKFTWKIWGSLPCKTCARYRQTEEIFFNCEESPILKSWWTLANKRLTTACMMRDVQGRPADCNCGWTAMVAILLYTSNLNRTYPMRPRHQLTCLSNTLKENYGARFTQCFNCEVRKKLMTDRTI